MWRIAYPACNWLGHPICSLVMTLIKLHQHLCSWWRVNNMPEKFLLSIQDISLCNMPQQAQQLSVCCRKLAETSLLLNWIPMTWIIDDFQQCIYTTTFNSTNPWTHVFYPLNLLKCFHGFRWIGFICNDTIKEQLYNNRQTTVSMLDAVMLSSGGSNSNHTKSSWVKLSHKTLQ